MRNKSIYNDMFEPIVLMEAYRGSISHNLYVPPSDPMSTDDVDTIRVFAYPLQYYLTLEGFHRAKETSENKFEEIDEVAYEVRKMFHLLSGANPNVINTLYLRRKDYTKMSEAWEYILKNKSMFSSKLVYYTYGGYAHSKIQSMTKGVKMGYMGEKRFALVKQFGYDTKDACHLIRLLRVGIEFLRDGEPQIYRTKDREELLSIKRGEWTLEEVQEESAKLVKELDSAYQKSDFPEKPNMADINKLLYEVMRMVLDLS